jgi:hypothetical protein
VKLSILEDLSFLGKKRVSDQEGAPYIFSCLDSDRLGLLSAKLISKHGPVLFEVAVLFARGGPMICWLNLKRGRSNGTPLLTMGLALLTSNDLV